MIITHKLQSMDLTNKQNMSRIDVVQDDKYSRDIEFTLTENGVAWQIPDGTTAVVRYKKPDGTGGNYDALPDGSTAYQINGNVLTVALAPQVCTVPGQVQLSVGLIHGSAEINTFTVNIAVHPNPGAEYQSEDYIKLSGAVPNSGWTPNMYLGTDASGNVVAKEGTSGGGSTSGKDVVGIQSVEQTTTSTEDGGTNIVTVTKTDGTSSTFQVKNGSKGSQGQAGTNGKSAYQYAVDGGYTGTEAEFAGKMAAEIPDKLPNPNALTFTGAVSGSYDGSAPLSVEIPSGGETGNEKDIDFTIEIQENTGSIDFEVDDKNEPLNLNECFILIYYIAGGTNTSNVNGDFKLNSLGPIVLNSLGVIPGQNYGRPWMLHVKKMFNTIFINAACMNTTVDITSIGVSGANFAYTYGLLFTESEKINKISISLYGTAAFAPGSKIRIIGR